MKLIHENLRKQKGFTLVELLVVIAIIATLAGISIPIGLRVFNSAKAAETKALTKEFVVAADAFAKDHGSIDGGIGVKVHDWSCNLLTGRIPRQVDGSNYSSAGARYTETKQHLRALVGKPVSAGHSETNKVYLKMRDNVNYKGGLTRDGSGNVHGMVDAWGRTYSMLFDIDYTGDIAATSSAAAWWAGDFAGAPVNLAGSVVGIFSPGSDGEFGGGDDISSWK